MTDGTKDDPAVAFYLGLGAASSLAGILTVLELPYLGPVLLAAGLLALGTAEFLRWEAQR